MNLGGHPQGFYFGRVMHITPLFHWADGHCHMSYYSLVITWKV